MTNQPRGTFHNKFYAPEVEVQPDPKNQRLTSMLKARTKAWDKLLKFMELKTEAIEKIDNGTKPLSRYTAGMVDTFMGYDRGTFYEAFMRENS